MIRLKYFPKTWKVAIITAIPKPGKDATLTSSYRPISLLPKLSKIFEKLFYKRLEPILEATQAIPNHQFGFRRRHSTVQQIHRVVNKILTDFDDNRFCIGVFLDVEKAFDKIWHKGLLCKLKRLLPYDFFCLLKSYISDRTFYVKYKNEYSTIRKINAGIPQGSVLGPLLYLLYTADIPCTDNHNSMTATFADDTILLSAHKNITEATAQLQQTLNKMKEWFDKWHIKINENKTSQIIFTTKRKFTPIPLTLNNTQIQIDQSAKYLGMHLDSKLTWKKHIEKKKKQIQEKVRQLNWLLNKRSKLSLNNKILIYKAIIKPIWTYGLQLWGTSKKSNVNIIQRQQSKILRTIVNAEWYIPNINIHNDLGISTINEEINKVSRKHQSTILAHENPDINSVVSLDVFLPNPTTEYNKAFFNFTLLHLTQLLQFTILFH